MTEFDALIGQYLLPREVVRHVTTQYDGIAEATLCQHANRNHVLMIASGPQEVTRRNAKVIIELCGGSVFAWLDGSGTGAWFIGRHAGDNANPAWPTSGTWVMWAEQYSKPASTEEEIHTLIRTMIQRGLEMGVYGKLPGE